MSDVENALTGAEAAPAENTAIQPEQTQETPQTPANAETDEQKEEKARDEKGRFVQKRINELTREKHEARRQAEQTRQELEQLRAEMNRLRQPAAPDPQTDFPGYVRHLASEEARQLVEQERSQWQQHQQQQHYQSLAQKFQAQEDAYSAEHPDYSEAVDAFASVAGVNPELGEVLATSDHGPAVVHYLGTHLDEAAKIAGLPVHLAAAAIARIEARVSVQKPKPVTNAPTPPPVLSGGKSAVRKDINDPDMPMGEWLALRNSQLKR